MKRMIQLRDKIAALLLLMLSGTYTFAQNIVGDPSVYDTKPQRDLVQYIGPCILLVLVIYVGYRYWHDNRPNDEQTHHHQ